MSDGKFYDHNYDPPKNGENPNVIAKSIENKRSGFSPTRFANDLLIGSFGELGLLAAHNFSRRCLSVTSWEDLRKTMVKTGGFA